MNKGHEARKRHKKVGLAPGSIVYIGEEKQDEVQIMYYSYDESNIDKEIYSKEFDIENLKPKRDVNWIDCDGIHDVVLIEKIGRLYGIDYLVLEDLVNTNQRPKLDERENYIFIVLKMISLNEETKEISYEQVSFVLGENYLLTFQQKPGDVFEHIRHRLENGVGKLRKRKGNYLLYSLLDTVVDHYFLIIEEFESRIDELETKVLNNPTKEDMQTIINLKKEIAFFRKSVNPTREIVVKLTNSEFLDENIKIFLRDLHDHSIIVYENVESLYLRTGEIMQLYHSALGNVMNEIMKFLTNISTIFIPLSFIVGFYGMNFENMPELRWKYGYYMIVSVMFAVVIFMVSYFRKKRWW